MLETTSEKVMLFCLISVTGSFAIFANDAWNLGNTGMIAAAFCAAMFTLFVSIVANLAADKIVYAVNIKRAREDDVEIAQIAGQMVYRAIREESEKMDAERKK